MELYDYELNLQSEIGCWRSSRDVECSMEFIPKPRHLQLGMCELLWSIEALPLQSPTQYSFNIMEVKPSRTPLPFSKAAVPDLPAKFKLLLVEFEVSMKSVHRAEEALNKFYDFSRLFLREKDPRRCIILDAKITATACKAAREAVYQAAKVAACFLVEQIEPPVFIDSEQSKSYERSGWWIENWTVADELWATSFFSSETSNGMMKLIQEKAVEGENVLQWCAVKKVPDKSEPYFAFEVAIQEFLEGDEVLLRIGVANDRALRVRVFLTDAVEVFCSQEGVEPETSLGLAYLLPAVVKDYIMAALERNEAKPSNNNNVVQGFLQHLIRYLVFLGKICVICGSDRLLEVPPSSTCSNICRARKQGYEASMAARVADLEISEEAKAARREKFVRKLYNDSIGRGSTGLEFLLDEIVAKMKETDRYKNAIRYEKAIGRVAKMDSRSIAQALRIPISQLWMDDTESSESYPAV